MQSLQHRTPTSAIKTWTGTGHQAQWRNDFTCLKNTLSGDVTDSIGRPTIFKTTSPDRPLYSIWHILLIIKALQNPLKFTIMLDFEVQGREFMPEFH